MSRGLYTVFFQLPLHLLFALFLLFQFFLTLLKFEIRFCHRCTPYGNAFRDRPGNRSTTEQFTGIPRLL